MTDREITIKIAEMVGDLNMLTKQAANQGLNVAFTASNSLNGSRINFEVKRNGKHVAV